MTDSLNVIDIISENVAALSTVFKTSERFEINKVLDDIDTTTKVIFMDRPLIENGRVLAQGNPVSTYNLTFIIFGDRMDLEAPQSTIESSLADVKALKRIFIIALQNEGRIDKINSYKTTELINAFDINCVALMIEVNLDITDSDSVC